MGNREKVRAKSKLELTNKFPKGVIHVRAKMHCIRVISITYGGKIEFMIL